MYCGKWISNLLFRLELEPVKYQPALMLALYFPEARFDGHAYFHVFQPAVYYLGKDLRAFLKLYYCDYVWDIDLESFRGSPYYRVCENLASA